MTRIAAPYVDIGERPSSRLRKNEEKRGVGALKKEKLREKVGENEKKNAVFKVGGPPRFWTRGNLLLQEFYGSDSN